MKTTLLGRDARENSLIKIIKEKNFTLTLAADSTFNFILHKDVLEFIKIAIGKDLQGIYNIVSSENIRISRLVKLLGKKVNFGEYIYNVGKIDNKKVSELLPSIKKSSEEVINKFTKLKV